MLKPSHRLLSSYKSSLFPVNSMQMRGVDIRSFKSRHRPFNGGVSGRVGGAGGRDGAELDGPHVMYELGGYGHAGVGAPGRRDAAPDNRRLWAGLYQSHIPILVPAAVLLLWNVGRVASGLGV